MDGSRACGVLQPVHCIGPTYIREEKEKIVWRASVVGKLKSNNT